jgi:hypothetical protein
MSAQADNDNATQVSTEMPVPFRLVAEAFRGQLRCLPPRQQVVKRARPRRRDGDSGNGRTYDRQ